MLQRLKLPYTLQWVFRLFMLYIVIFSSFRLSAYFLFNPNNYTTLHDDATNYNLAHILPSLALGLLYDARWICIVLAPIVIASFIPRLSPFKTDATKQFWIIYLIIITFLILFFFAADFGHFQYVRTRLNASALNFFEDARISFEMIWESYPILWLLLGLGILVFLLTYLVNRTYFKVTNQNASRSPYDYQRRWYVITLLLFASLIYGNIGTTPLTRDDSFRRMDNEFTGFLALNPFQNFFTTLKFRNPSFAGNQVNQTVRYNGYSQLANLLQLPASNAPDTTYLRSEKNTTLNPPNIVLVMCESLSTYKTSLSGNPLNATPYLQQLSTQSIYFNRCFSPAFGTARGLFAWLTGIPDVQLSMFSSRNKMAVAQHTIINNFTNYNKYYFIGGSTKFNNFNGLIKNINGVHLYEEKDYEQKRVNVWGISDKDLFETANKKMATVTQPFFTVIQTADNHEPYTIPIADNTFTKSTLDKKIVKANGFNNLAEFNALRYFDHTVQHFITQAKKEKYFDNTIFIFFGDHGVIGNAGTLYPNVYTEQRITEEHIPLIIYAPKLLAPQLRNEVVSQIDILPTIAALAKQSYTNTTLGRNILDSTKQGNYAFTIFHDAGKIGLITDSFYYIHNFNTNDDELYPMLNNNPIPYTVQQAIIPYYKQLSITYYETAKWMLTNNKPLK